MKRLSLKSVFSVLLAAAMTFSCMGAAAASPAPEYEGYIIKLKDDAVLPFDSSAEIISDSLVAVDSISEAELFDPEDIVYIEPDYTVELFSAAPSAAPNDPYYADYQWNLQSIGAYEAQLKGLTGKGVKIGSIDSGINRSHEDLQGLNLKGTSFAEGENYFEDSFGHGTFTCGIISARTNNGTGLAGAAPGAELYVYRVFLKQTTKISYIVKAIDQAIADGCQIINMSFGASKPSTPLSEAIGRAVDKGIFIAAAVGKNGSTDITYPAGCEGVVGVGSVDRDMTCSYFSHVNSSVDLTAPGGGVPGLSNTANDGYLLDLNSISNKGTSFSSPLVASMAAMALEYESTMTPGAIFNLMKMTSTDRGPEGRDDEYGWGVINMEAFVDELTSDYTITYETGSGVLPQDAPLSYNVKNRPALPTLSVPEGCEFKGWFTDPQFTSPALTELSADTVGDITLYAGIASPEDAVPVSVTVKNAMTELQPDGSYLAYLPHGEDLSLITTEDITVTAKGPDDKTSAVKNPDGSFTLTVTTSPLEITRSFTLRLSDSGTEISGSIESALLGKSGFMASLYRTADSSHACSARVGFDGSFAMRGVAPGSYFMVVSGGGCLSVTVTDINAGSENISLADSLNPNVQTIRPVSGDVNSDGSVNEEDVSAIRMPQNINLPSSQSSTPFADVNGDGVVNEEDVSAVRMPKNINRSSSDFVFSFIG